MAEFNSKKGFVFVSKIKNLYFVPNDISREIDSMLICSGKNPNKYIKIVKKENTLNAGIINSPIKKVIFITQEWANMLQNNPNNNLVWNAFSGTIYHELGHQKDYMPNGLLRKMLITICNFFGICLRNYHSNQLQFLYWVWEAHADFYSCEHAFKGDRCMSRKTMLFKLDERKKRLKSIEDTYDHPSWMRRISYIEKFNFDEQLITKIAMDASYPVSCVEVQNIILHYETYFD